MHPQLPYKVRGRAAIILAYSTCLNVWTSCWYAFPFGGDSVVPRAIHHPRPVQSTSA